MTQPKITRCKASSIDAERVLSEIIDRRGASSASSLASSSVASSLVPLVASPVPSKSARSEFRRQTAKFDRELQAMEAHLHKVYRERDIYREKFDYLLECARSCRCPSRPPAKCFTNPSEHSNFKMECCPEAGSPESAGQPAATVNEKNWVKEREEMSAKVSQLEAEVSRLKSFETQSASLSKQLQVSLQQLWDSRAQALLQEKSLYALQDDVVLLAQALCPAHPLLEEPIDEDAPQSLTTPTCGFTRAPKPTHRRNAAGTPLAGSENMPPRQSSSNVGINSGRATGEKSGFKAPKPTLSRAHTTSSSSHGLHHRHRSTDSSRSMNRGSFALQNPEAALSSLSASVASNLAGYSRTDSMILAPGGVNTRKSDKITLSRARPRARSQNNSFRKKKKPAARAPSSSPKYSFHPLFGSTPVKQTQAAASPPLGQDEHANVENSPLYGNLGVRVNASRSPAFAKYDTAQLESPEQISRTLNYSPELAKLSRPQSSRASAHQKNIADRATNVGRVNAQSPHDAAKNRGDRSAIQRDTSSKSPQKLGPRCSSFSQASAQNGHDASSCAHLGNTWLHPAAAAGTGASASKERQPLSPRVVSKRRESIDLQSINVLDSYPAYKPAPVATSRSHKHSLSTPVSPEAFTLKRPNDIDASAVRAHDRTVGSAKTAEAAVAGSVANGEPKKSVLPHIVELMKLAFLHVKEKNFEEEFVRSTLLEQNSLKLSVHAHLRNASYSTFSSAKKTHRRRAYSTLKNIGGISACLMRRGENGEKAQGDVNAAAEFLRDELQKWRKQAHQKNDFVSKSDSYEKMLAECRKELEQMKAKEAELKHKHESLRIEQELKQNQELSRLKATLCASETSSERAKAEISKLEEMLRARDQTLMTPVTPFISLCVTMLQTFIGDYLDVETNFGHLMPILAGVQGGRTGPPPTIVFADRVLLMHPTKIGNMREYFLVVTNRECFHVHPKSREVVLRYGMEDIESVSLNFESHDTLVVHMDRQSDVVYRTSKCLEVLTALSNTFESVMDADLRVDVSKWIHIHLESGAQARISFRSFADRKYKRPRSRTADDMVAEKL